ncbi:MAG: hypothetical protein PF447_11470, partial [Spirochaetaceae bacterium]|nr:hypothetical protein [Spirochaetaceae bacterium]
LGTKATLMIGNFPPSPFPLELTINKQAETKLRCSFKYDTLPYEMDIISDLETRVNGFTIIKEFQLY